MTGAKKNVLAKNARELAIVAGRCARVGPAGGKDEFHRLGKRFLRNVLDELGVEGDVRSCLGGPAVVGEAILHTDKVYVMLCVSSFGGPVQFMYRTCQGRKDYTGGNNRWAKYEHLVENVDGFVEELKRLSC